MSCCTQPTITGEYILPSSFQTVTSLDVTNSLTTGEAVHSSVITFNSVVNGAFKCGTIDQIVLREEASSAGNIKKPDLFLLLWHGNSPTTPTANAVYSTPVNDSFIGCFIIAASDYVRLSETIHEATVRPDRRFVTQSSGVTSTLYGVLLSNESSGVTFASGASLKVRLFISQDNTVSQIPS